MATTPRQLATALERVQVCNGRQGDMLVRLLERDDTDPHTPLHQSVAGLWERVLSLEAQLAELESKRKPAAKTAA